ncbi:MULTISPECIES: hypothetical protein [Mycobacterium]|uniref:hypothetical protein n=1 Tax=Mycobacterium TaxID=1763 RepID=UPI0013D60DB5|nr:MULTISPECIES: hypothetical protein [Mycobacterium]MDV3135363.1 hypothetical protein [Mycobacterium sp. 29Ha]
MTANPATRVLFAAAAMATATWVAACSTSTTDTGAGTTAPAATTTVTTTVTAPTTVAPEPSPTTTSTPTVAAGDCAINPANRPVPVVERYDAVSEADQIDVSISGIPSGTVTPGAAPVEFEVELCNTSPVSYPSVGVVVVLENCSCVPDGLPIAKGTVDYFDPAAGSWTPLEHPAAGTGTDFMGGYENVQEFPKGKTVSLRYRLTLDPSMTNGEGGVAAYAMNADGSLNQLGTARLPFNVRTGG